MKVSGLEKQLAKLGTEIATGLIAELAKESPAVDGNKHAGGEHSQGEIEPGKGKQSPRRAKQISVTHLSHSSDSDSD
jgi:hypothetical protein